MRFLALATDYDGTLATCGSVGASTLKALGRLLASGRRLILATGRELKDVKAIFPQLAMFDRVVAENGATLYCPQSNEEKLLCAPPPEEFIAKLRERNVPLATGKVVVATREPSRDIVLETIREFGLELQVILNKGSVMVLPSGVDKSSGLKCALEELRLSPHSVVGVGDAENDQAFLAACECSAAVANALPELKRQVDIVTSQPEGAGVEELIEELLANDLASHASSIGGNRKT